MAQSAYAATQSVGATELHGALECVLSGHFGGQRYVTKLGRRSSPYRTGFALEELDVYLDDGTTVQLLCKDLSYEALLENVRRIKPAFLHDPLREIETYRTILEPSELSTATCYGAVVEPHLKRYWLFIERVPGYRLSEVEEAAWHQAARWLALMHSHFARQTNLPAQAGVAHLLQYNADFYGLWPTRAQAFSRRRQLSQASICAIEWLAKQYSRVIEHLVALPTTLIHGEYFASNVLVQETLGGLRVCPVDWEMTAVGPGLIDVAALTAGWTERGRLALALTYYAALTPHLACPLEQDVFLTSLDYCRLHLAMQFLGWSPEWSPPAGHAQNWLGEAVRLAEKLGL